MSKEPEEPEPEPEIDELIAKFSPKKRAELILWRSIVIQLELLNSNLEQIRISLDSIEHGIRHISHP